MQDVSEQKIGQATYVIERVFSGTKSLQQVVTEEIVFAAKQAAKDKEPDTYYI